MEFLKKSSVPENAVLESQVDTDGLEPKKESTAKYGLEFCRSLRWCICGIALPFDIEVAVIDKTSETERLLDVSEGEVHLMLLTEEHIYNLDLNTVSRRKRELDASEEDIEMKRPALHSETSSGFVSKKSASAPVVHGIAKFPKLKLAWKGTYFIQATWYRPETKAIPLPLVSDMQVDVFDSLESVVRSDMCKIKRIDGSKRVRCMSCGAWSHYKHQEWLLESVCKICTKCSSVGPLNYGKPVLEENAVSISVPSAIVKAVPNSSEPHVAVSPLASSNPDSAPFVGSSPKHDHPKDNKGEAGRPQYVQTFENSGHLTASLELQNPGKSQQTRLEMSVPSMPHTASASPPLLISRMMNSISRDNSVPDKKGLHRSSPSSNSVFAPISPRTIIPDAPSAAEKRNPLIQRSSTNTTPAAVRDGQALNEDRETLPKLNIPYNAPTNQPVPASGTSPVLRSIAPVPPSSLPNNHAKSNIEERSAQQGSLGQRITASPTVAQGLKRPWTVAEEAEIRMRLAGAKSMTPNDPKVKKAEAKYVEKKVEDGRIVYKSVVMSQFEAYCKNGEPSQEALRTRPNLDLQLYLSMHRPLFDLSKNPLFPTKK